MLTKCMSQDTVTVLATGSHVGWTSGPCGGCRNTGRNEKGPNDSDQGGLLAPLGCLLRMLAIHHNVCLLSIAAPCQDPRPSGSSLALPPSLQPTGPQLSLTPAASCSTLARSGSLGILNRPNHQHKMTQDTPDEVTSPSPPPFPPLYYIRMHPRAPDHALNGPDHQQHARTPQPHPLSPVCIPAHAYTTCEWHRFRPRSQSAGLHDHSLICDHIAEKNEQEDEEVVQHLRYV